jgi:hypothetical protein
MGFTPATASTPDAGFAALFQFNAYTEGVKVEGKGTSQSHGGEAEVS